MNPKTILAFRLICWSAAIGVVGAVLLKGTPWGINAPLFLAGVTIAVGAAAKARALPRQGLGRFILALSVLFACGLAWRDSPTLRFLDGTAAGLCLLLGTPVLRMSRLPDGGFLAYLFSAGRIGRDAAFGLPGLVANEMAWAELPRPTWTRHLKSVARGLAVAVPLLLVFGGLLASADAAFESLLSIPLDIDGQLIVPYVGIGCVCAWIAGGLLRGTAFGEDPEVRKPLNTAHTAGIVEVGIVLGTLDLLFLAFVGVQLQYLFGGSEFVANGPSYAEYARRGFFELVAVTALALPVVLVSRSLLRDGRPVAQRVFAVLSGILIALLFIVMASAVQRMSLYTAQYGLTELRLYSTGFMLWLAMAFAWTAVTVLRNKPHAFMPGVLAAAGLVIAGLNVMNPDALIVRTNITRIGTCGIDTSYLASLSSDAVSALIKAGITPRRVRGTGEDGPLAESESSSESDLRTWNWSRANAERLLERARLDARKQIQP